MITVAIADDHRVVRVGLEQLLATFDDVDVVGAGAGGREAVAICGAHHPDVLLLDLSMPDLDGIEATRGSCGVPRHPGGGVHVVLRSRAHRASARQRRDRLPVEGRRARRDPRRDPGRLARRIAPRSPRRRRTPGDDGPEWARSNSPHVNVRCWGWSWTATPTSRSPAAWGSARRRSRATSRTCSSGSGWPIALRRRCGPNAPAPCATGPGTQVPLGPPSRTPPYGHASDAGHRPRVRRPGRHPGGGRRRQRPARFVLGAPGTGGSGCSGRMPTRCGSGSGRGRSPGQSWQLFISDNGTRIYSATRTSTLRRRDPGEEEHARSRRP